MRWVGWLLLGVGCGGEGQGFDVVAYCDLDTSCAPSGEHRVVAMDQCIYDWEAQRDHAVRFACEEAWARLERCVGDWERSCDDLGRCDARRAEAEACLAPHASELELGG